MKTNRSLQRIALAVLLLTSAAAQQESFTDPRDGQIYETVTIGSQTWSKENIRYDTGPGSRCFEDLASNCEQYGRLYTWPDVRLACPAGWRLPTEDDWRRLETFLGMEDVELAGLQYRGVDEGASLRVGGDSGFDALLSGYMRPDGTPRRMNERAAFWTATEHEPAQSSWHRDISADPRVYRSAVDHEYYLSVRCVAQRRN